jgi:DNA polymerase-1
VSTLLAVDGNSLAHRAWHALREEATGGPWVTDGIVRMLSSAWIHGPYDAVVFAFDSSASLRRELYPEYKSHRDDNDPALTEQISLAASTLAACGLHVISSEGYEADDLLAATAEAIRRLPPARCHVLSSDRDLTAVVSERVTLLRPRRTMSDIRIYDVAAVEAEYGVAPRVYLQLAALRGDPSDDLPGVRGIGRKTAAKLLRSFGSVEEVYANLRYLDHKVAAELRAARDDVERNLLLMSPLGTHDLDVAAMLGAGIDVDRVDATLTAAGLGRAAGVFRWAFERGPLPPKPPPPDEDPIDGVTIELPEPPAAPIQGEQVGLFE